MVEELKPCPFCGGEAHSVRDSGGAFAMRCNSHHCCGYQTTSDDYGEFYNGVPEADAIAAWNTRPIEDALRAENERLERQLARANPLKQSGLQNTQIVTYYSLGEMLRNRSKALPTKGGDA